MCASVIMVELLLECAAIVDYLKFICNCIDGGTGQVPPFGLHYLLNYDTILYKNYS